MYTYIHVHVSKSHKFVLLLASSSSALILNTFLIDSSNNNIIYPKSPEHPAIKNSVLPNIKSHLKTYRQLPLTLMCMCRCLKFINLWNFILNTLKLSKCNTTHVCNISYGNKVRSSKVTDDSSTGADTHMTNERNKPPETGTIVDHELSYKA